MKKKQFRALALSAVALLSSAFVYVQAAGEDDPDVGSTPTSVDFTLSENPYNLVLSGGYLPAGTLMKQGPISAVYNNDRASIGSFYGQSSSAEGASITFVPDAGYKITSVKFLQNGTTDRTDKFEVDGYTYNKTTSGTTNVSNIIVEYEEDADSGVANVEVANAFTEAISQSARNAYSYFANIGFAGEDARSLIYSTLPEALKNFKTESAKFSSVEEVEKYFAGEDTKFCDFIKADIKTSVDPAQENSFYFRPQVLIDAKSSYSYLSNSLYAIGTKESSYITNSSSINALFSSIAAGSDPEVFHLYSVSSGVNMASTSEGEGLIGPKGENMPNELSFKMVLNGNHVQLVLADNDAKAVGVDAETGLIKLLDATDPATLLCVSRSTKENTLSSVSSAVYSWSTIMPDFKNDVTSFRERITAAETLIEATAILKESQKAMIDKFTQGEVNLAINGLAGKYIGNVDGVWKTDIPYADAPKWILTFDSNETAYASVKLYDKTSGSYIGANGTVTNNSDEAASYAFIFEPSSGIALVIPDKNTDNCLKFNLDNYDIILGNYCDRLSALSSYTFKFVYNPIPLAEVVTALTEYLEKAEDLGKLYLKSVSFAGQNARNIIDKNIGAALDNIDPVAAPIRSIEAAEAYVADIVANLEAAILSDLNAAVGKELVFWQPGQKGYLSALTRDPGNKGFVDFDYQAKINEDAAWTPVADATEGQFFMKSAKGQYISTPNVNYCHVAEEQPTAPDGAFTFGVKDGYVILQSVAHEGCGLGFDCQNDPVEIMKLTDKSNGYRWQVAMMENFRHDYVTFTSERWTAKYGHDVYLQDANEPLVSGNNSSTLCGTENLSANTVWELLKGTADGTYHIRNFATGKYLVKLDTPSQTVDNPVNIWLSENGNGVSIATNANNTAYYTCLDADNGDLLTGKWHVDGGNGTVWIQTAISEDEVRAKYGNVYVTFESNNKEWGVYLQDTFVPAAGTDATLCGVDSVCQNAIWQITPGSAEGAYYVQNFATKKYLVALNADGSKTVSEPVDIWMPELTIGEKAGVQICTASAPADSNCLATNETGKVAGVGANSAACLWIKSQLDEYTDEQISAIYPAQERTVAIAIENQVKAFRADCENYLISVPCGEEIIKDAIVRLDEIIANADEVAKQFKRVAFLDAYFKELKASYEAPLLEELNKLAAEGTVFSFQINSLAGGFCYYSSSLYSIDDSNAALLPTKEFSAGNLFRFEQCGDDFALYSVNSGRIYADLVSISKIGTRSEKFAIEALFRFTLADGFVRLNGIKSDQSLVPIGIFNTRGTLGGSNADATTLNLKLETYTIAEVAEMANTQLALWGALTPGGDKIASDAAPTVTAAKTAAEIGEIMADAKKAMISAVVNNTEDVYFKSVNTGLFIGFDSAWYADFEEKEASAWKFILPEETELSGSYFNLFLMKDETAGVYMSYRAGNTLEPNTNPVVAQPDYYAIAFDNPGIITISVPRNSMANALAATADGVNTNGTYGDRYKAESIAPYCFAFATKGGTVGVENVTINYEKDVIYDLNGNRVNNPGKGIYIVNGKKVVKTK